MILLLDVNVLVALGLREHTFHERVARWILDVRKQPDISFATCSLTELGFVRVLAQNRQWTIPVRTAVLLLRKIRRESGMPFRFLSDSNDASQLPDWVIGPRQTTDGHLQQLAQTHGAVLATMDERIPGALLLPELFSV